MPFGCIYVPDFPVQAAIRTESQTQREQKLAVAILDGPESLPKVFACNQAARSCGVVAGMTRLQAEACGAVRLCRRQPWDEESAQAALLDCGYGFSPRIESTSPGTVIVDLAGTGLLWGTLQEIGHELARRTRGCGFETNIGIGGNPDAALCAARGFAGVAVILPGEEALRLAPLSIEILEPGNDILTVLDGWGIRTFQALSSLPPLSLAQRMGQEGLRLQRLARGEVERELVLAEPPVSFAESMELEDAVELLEPLAFVINRLLERITTRLEARSLGTDQIRIELELEIHRDRQTRADSFTAPQATYERSVKLPVPTQDPMLLLKLLQLDLAAHPPQGPVKKIALTAQPAQMRFTQAGLFQPLAPEAGKLEIALARLRAVVGEQDELGRSRVGSPAVVDSHFPDSFVLQPFRSNISSEVRECLPSPRLALRLFRPAAAAKVEWNGKTPTSVVFGGAKSEVMNCAGPWRNCGQWWDREGKWERDEWDVVLKIDGGFGLYRLIRDLSSAQWFVEGMYD